MRYSRKRELIRDIVKGRSDHPTAEMVYKSARVLEPAISLGTVYRNLKQLADEGEIVTLETMDKKIHYDGCTDGHIHFICKSCGKIIDYFKPMNIIEIVERDDIAVTDSKCVFYGYCKECNRVHRLINQKTAN